LDLPLVRDSPFSFACRVCGRCCSGKIIMAGPHEVLGMARLLGVSTTDFIRLYSDHGGTTLRSEPDGRCVFVTEAGCRVHPRRPLVCRLYPLGRMTDGAGEERFYLFPKPPDCEAELGSDGTISSFLESQGVGPYLDWSDRYGRVYKRMMALLESLGLEGRIDVPAEPDPGSRPEQDAAPDNTPLSSWQDIDASLAEYCAAKGTAVPESIGEAIDLHLRAMGEWLDGLESRLGDHVYGRKRA
jgi:hypothetical protein